MGMLLAARDEETGLGMDEKQIRDEVLTLLIAGHETTALLMTWLFYCLGCNPDVEAQLHDEVDRTLNGRVPTFEDIPNLVYTRQVVDETMRVYPPAYALSRACNDADVVGGYAVQPNSVITLSPYITHRLPEFWDDPDRFDPERFAPAKNAARHRFAYIPFGAGPRQCIGGADLVSPEDARATGVEGRVVVRYDVTTAGTVANAVVVESEPPGVFDAAALDAVRSWRFRPMVDRGEVVSAPARVSELVFRLGESSYDDLPAPWGPIKTGISSIFEPGAYARCTADNTGARLAQRP